MGAQHSIESDEHTQDLKAEGGKGPLCCCCRSGDEHDKEIASGAIIREALIPEVASLHPKAFSFTQAESSQDSPCSSQFSDFEDSVGAQALPLQGRGSWHAEGGSYTSLDALAQSLTAGDAVLVWGSWLAELAKSSARPVMPRRQNVPPEAVCSAEEIRKGTPLLAVSYCWATSAHPDPEGAQLQLLGQLLDCWLTSLQRRREPAPHVVAPEESWLKQNEIEGETRTDVAVLLDWCSIYQEPRFADERRTSELFLQQVGRWFAHEHTNVWLFTQSPIGAEPYSRRGWPTFERAVSLLPIRRKEVMDIGLLQRTPDMHWQDIVRQCRAKRLPPQMPSEFLAELQQKHFSWSFDRDLLGILYREVYEDVVERAVEMPLARLNWGDPEMQLLHSALGSCCQLQRLNLAQNHIGNAGAEALAETLLQSPRLLQSLHLLDLSGNEIGNPGLCSLAAALPSARAMQALGFDSNFIGDHGAGSLALALPQCGGLQRLILCRNEIGDSGAGELARAMPRCNLQILDLSENEVSDVGAERFAAALPNCGKLQRFDLARNYVGDRGAVALAAALPKCQLEAFGLGGHDVGEILGGERIGDGGAGLLASALLRCERLCKLDLSENQIGDGGTAQLAAVMPHCGQLAELDLYRNCIADHGVKRLAEAVPQCGHLDWLRLLENPYGIKGASRLVEAWEAAGKPKGRLLCQPAPSRSGGFSGYSGWASWGSPILPERRDSKGRASRATSCRMSL
ncbi:unnamed protein product [Effrenium voratum]|nr:unnamed protein product [Effrenium voratum]